MLAKKIEEFIKLGYELTKGRVVLSELNGKVRRYQVYSDDFRFPFSAVYNETDLDIAVDKFILIINEIKRTNDKHKKSKAENKSV